MSARRRRRLLAAGTVVVLAGLGSVVQAAASSGRVEPDQPVASAISRDGNLYIGDRGRNEILEWMPSGGFRIVAGTGTAGLTGDGGPADRAEIHDPGGLVLSSDGTLYFTQAGRGPSSGGMQSTVIREITPAGTIRTIAGLHPRCGSGAVRSIPAEAALFYGASLSLSPSGGLVVDAHLCVGSMRDRGFGPNLLLRSGRFVEYTAHPMPAADCGSGVAGRGFHAFACMSGGGHPRELLVVRSDGSSVAFPDYRGGDFAVGAGKVVATYDVGLVRVTRSHLVPLLTVGELARALHIRSTAIADVYAPSVDARGDVYFVGSMLSSSGCQNRILERTTEGAVHQIWASATSRDNTCG